MSVRSTIVGGFSKLKLRSTRMLLILAGLLVLPIVSFTSTAHAYSCYSGALCVWKDINGTGATTFWSGSWHNECYNLNSTWDNVISSVQNEMSVSVTFWKYANCGTAPGDGFSLAPHHSASYPNLPLNWIFNDAISSIYFW